MAKTNDGIRVVDVWETKEQFERFAQEQIGPYTREAGITEEPEMRFCCPCRCGRPSVGADGLGPEHV